MKTVILNKNLMTVALLLSFVLVSCNESGWNNAGKEIATGIASFVQFIIQIANIIFFGISALVFSILSITTSKQTYKIVGGIFLAIFITVAGLGYLEVHSMSIKKYYLFLIVFIIELVIIIISIIFLLKKSKVKTTER